jgi:inosose dehydratase
MLTATDPAHVSFCLDVHWVFRGCGDSQVALFDVLEHYGDRVVELHLRQSKDGVWTEVFSAEGDIAYGRVADWLRRRKVHPQLTLEQAVEAKSPKTIDAVSAHREGVRAVRALFAGHTP